MSRMPTTDATRYVRHCPRTHAEKPIPSLVVEGSHCHVGAIGLETERTKNEISASSVPRDMAGFEPF